MAWSFLQATKQARADTITSQIGTGGHLSVWFGTLPSTYTTLLVEWTWTGNMFNPATAVAQPVLVMISPTTNPMTPVASNTAVIARVYNAARTLEIITGLSVGTSGTDVIISNTAISTATQVSLNSFTITEAL